MNENIDHMGLVPMSAEVSEATQMSDGQDWTEPIKLTAAECEQLNEALEGEQK